MSTMSASLWPSGRLDFMKKSPENHPVQNFPFKKRTDKEETSWTSLYDNISEIETKSNKNWLPKIILCILVLLSFLGLLVFFLWPRIPAANILKVTYANGDDLSQPLESRVGLVKVKDSHLPPGLLGNKPSFYGVKLRLLISISSDNYIPIHINNIVISVFKNVNQKLGGGHLIQPISLSPRGTTVVGLPLDVILNDMQRDVITLFKESCNPNPSLRRPLILNYSAQVHLNLLDLLGIKPPTISGSFDLNCPWDINSALTKIAVETLSNNLN